MQSAPTTSGDMSQDSQGGATHRTGVTPDAAPPLRPALDRAARTSKRMYEGLSASSAGLEMGLSVAIGMIFGNWLDGRLGTRPWMMMAFLVFGMIAGFRGVLRAVARAERAAKAEAAESKVSRG